MTLTLTNRQKSVLSMYADDYDVQQIADYLYLTCSEVRTLLAECRVALGANTMAEAAQYACELGLIGTGRVVA